MLFHQIAIVSLFGAFAAATSPLEARDYNACPGSLYSVPSCCDLNVAEILGVTCEVAGETPGSPSQFAEICAAGGQGASCCALPVAGSAIGCHPPVGV